MSKWYLRKKSGEFLTNAQGQVLYENISLPTGYQEVDYIQATGTQYIDTGYVLKSNKVKVELSAAWTGTNTGTFATYVGFMPSATTPRFGLHNYSGKIMHGMNATISIDAVPVDKNIHFYIIEGNGSTQSLTIDNVTYTSATAYDISSNTLSLTLFARRASSSAIGNQMHAKIYRCKIWVDGKVVRNMIPCYRTSDNVIGMYDVVNGVFYTNKGTGTFTKGFNVSN